MGGLSGKAGTVVFVRGPGGATYIRPRVKPRDPQSPAQSTLRRYLSRAAQAWRELDLEEARQWALYAAKLDRTIGGGPRQPRNVFSGLAVKFLLVDPDREIPRVPPVAGFTGDGIVVTVAEGRESERGLQSAFGAADFSPPPPQQSEVCSPRSGLKPALLGGVVFEANAANGPDVTTELLTQRVGSLHSRGTPALFRTAGYFAFVEGTLSTTVPVTRGCYACGVRFVRPSTGQASELMVVGTVKVQG